MQVRHHHNIDAALEDAVANNGFIVGHHDWENNGQLTLRLINPDLPLKDQLRNTLL